MKKILSRILIFLLLVVSLWAPGIGRASASSPAFVQGAVARTYGSMSSSVSFDSNVVSGDAIAVAILWGSTTANLNKVTASCVSGDFTLVDNPTVYSSASSAAQGYALANSSGPCTVTAQFSGYVNSTIVVHEISGVDSQNPLDGHSMANQDVPGTATDAVSSGTIVTTQDGDYIFGVSMDAGGNAAVFTVGTGFTERIVRASTSGLKTEDRIQASAGPIAATFTMTPGWAHPTTGVMAFRGASSEGPDTTPPGVVMSAPVVNVVVSWTTDEPATSQIEYGLADSYGQFTALDQNLVTSHSVEITGLLPNTAYEYRVRSKDAAGNETVGSGQTFIAQVGEVSSVPVDTEAPTIPSGLSGSAVSPSQINLSWSASSDDFGVAGYRIYRDAAFLATTTETSFSDTGLTASTTYSYSISAYDAAGNVSARSSAVSVSTDPVIVSSGYGFLDFEAGADGDLATPSLLSSVTHGLSGIWTMIDDGTKLTISTSSAHALVNPVVSGGVTYSDAGTRGLKTSWSGNNHAELMLDARYPNLSAGFHFKSSGGFNYGTHDLFNLHDSGRGIYAVLQMTDNPVNGPQIHFHSNGGGAEHPGVGQPVYISPDHWYWTTIKFASVGGRGQLNVYDAENGYSLVGTSYIDITQINPYNDYAADKIWIGAAKYGGSEYTDQSTSFDNIKISTDGEFPLMP